MACKHYIRQILHMTGILKYALFHDVRTAAFIPVIEFDMETGGYFPMLYLNDYWNLAQEYMPLNDTTP